MASRCLKPPGNWPLGSPASGASSKCCIAQSMRCRLASPMQPIGAGKELEVFADRQLAIERELLGDVADALPGRGAGMVQIDSGHAQRAAAGREQSAQHPKGRRLAGAVGPEQSEDFAALHFEADVIDGREGAKTPNQIVHLHDGCCRGRDTRAGAKRRSRADRGLRTVALRTSPSDRRPADRRPADRSLRFRFECAAQQHHETVFKTRLDWLTV